MTAEITIFLSDLSRNQYTLESVERRSLMPTIRPFFSFQDITASVLGTVFL